MVVVKAKLEASQGSVVPIAVPDRAEIHAFAENLRQDNTAWEGEAFGWTAEYSPELEVAPVDSKMTFTPAMFCIGESGIWFYSLMWENGRDSSPSEFLDDNNLVPGF